MRLLRVEPDGKFSLIVDRFQPADVPQYVILSHRWEPENQEVTFKDLRNGLKDGKNGFRKLQFCRDQAEKDGFEFFWVDSCCVDKSSSAEVSESVNSMYRWYKEAQICYVYLTDVSKPMSTLVVEQSTSVVEQSNFQASKWFTRGWTLQELLAPRIVEFYSREGHFLGDKVSLGKQINLVTGISTRALKGGNLFEFSVDEKKSWSEGRVTTLEEDRAYCLFGIFDVNMPLIYGEGYERALMRLQDEIDEHYSSPKLHGYVRWTREQRRCLQLLGDSDYQNFKDQVPDRLEGTCQWFLQDPRFHTWRDGPSSILWLSAGPASGKSALAKSLIDFVFPNSIRCAFFFKNSAQNDAITAVSAILHQLFLQKPSLIRHAMPEFLTNRSQLLLSFDKLWSIFTASITELDEIVCILDGFEACKQWSRDLLLRGFNSLFKKQQTSSSRHPSIRLFISSRPFIEISETLNSAEGLTEYLSNIVLHKEDTLILCSDILQFIKHRISLLESDWYHEINETDKHILAKEILSFSHRGYLWSAFVLDAISSASRAADPKRFFDKDVIFWAAESGCFVFMKLLRQLGILFELNIRDSNYQTVLHKAAEKGHASIVQLLLEIGFDVNARDKFHQTPLFCAAFRGRHSVVKLLLEKKPEFKLLDLKRRTPLHVASTNGHESVVKLLLESGTVNINATDRDGYTPLLLACKNGHESIVKLLLNSKAVIINATNSDGCTPLVLACQIGHESIVKLLLHTGKADLNNQQGKKRRTPLLWAVENGHKSIVKLLLQSESINADLQDNDRFTPLALAAILGNYVMTKLLLDSGKVNVSTRSYLKRTPLSWASKNGHFGVVNLLLKAQPNIQSSSYWDATKNPSLLMMYSGSIQEPLWLAAENGHEAIVERLMKAGANINSNSVLGTPLYTAAKNGHRAVVQLLVASKADVNLRPLKDHSKSEFLRALRPDRESSVAKQLALLIPQIKFGLVLNAKTHAIRYDRAGPPLSAACENGHEEIVKILLGANAEVKVFGSTYKQPLFLAQMSGHQMIVKLLKTHKQNTS